MHWSLTTLREKLVKIGAKVVRHGRYVTFQLAEVAVPRNLFRKILRRYQRLLMTTGGGARTRGFASGVGAKAGIGAADPTLVYDYTP